MIIQKETVLAVADNSGAYKVRCIGIPGKGAKKFGKVGDLITVSIAEAEPYHAKAKVKKGDIFKAVIVATKSSISNKYGMMTSFSENLVVLLDPKSNYNAINLVGTRINTVISAEIKNFSFLSPIVLIATKLE